MTESAFSEAKLVLFQQDGLIIIDKPSGMSVHNELPSLQNSLRGSFPKLHFVNRLDLDTSGIVVATTQANDVADLAAALQSADSEKIYRAIVKRPRDEQEFFRKQKASDENWIWTDPITDKAEGHKNPLGIARDRVGAETHATVIGRSDFFWELQVRILTGRQHQIRKHCAFHQLPIVGDGRYGRAALNQKTCEVYQVSRMMLHAWRIEFQWRGKTWSFTSPRPAEFAPLIPLK
jgi:23S rRNA-/tRNA-specific pseudouridylate synthase